MYRIQSSCTTSFIFWHQLFQRIKTREFLFEIFIFPPNCSSISLQHSRRVGFVEVSRQKVCAEGKPVNGQNFIIFIQLQTLSCLFKFFLWNVQWLSTCIHGQKLRSQCCPHWEIASQEDAPNNAKESFTEFVHIFGRVEGIFLRMKNWFWKKWHWIYLHYLKFALVSFTGWAIFTFAVTPPWMTG